MRTTLEDLYYGSITPCEQQMIPGSELKRAVNRVAKCEEQLMGLLNEEGQETLTSRTVQSVPEKAAGRLSDALPGIPATTPDPLK